MSSLLEQIARRRRASAARRLGRQLPRSEPTRAAGTLGPETHNGQAHAVAAAVKTERIVWQRGGAGATAATGAAWAADAPGAAGAPEAAASPVAGVEDLRAPKPELGHNPEVEVEVEVESELEIATARVEPDVEDHPEAETEMPAEVEPPLPGTESDDGLTIDPDGWSQEDELLASAVRTVDHGWGPVKLSRARRGRGVRSAQRSDQAPAREPQPSHRDAPGPELTDDRVPQPEASGGYLERGRIRRRARYLRHLREIQLRDIGGFMVELHRFEQERPELVLAKVEDAARTDAELRALQRALGESSPIRELREAGIGGACAACGAVHGSEDRFCAACGTDLADARFPADQASPAHPVSGL